MTIWELMYAHPWITLFFLSALSGGLINIKINNRGDK